MTKRCSCEGERQHEIVAPEAQVLLVAQSPRGDIFHDLAAGDDRDGGHKPVEVEGEAARPRDR